MTRACTIAAALVGIFLAAAPAAWAHGRADFWVGVGSALPGDAVTVRGVFVPPDFSAVTEPVTVTLGEDGAVLGQATVAADGSWTLTFTVPSAAALGTYALYAVVLDSNGSVLDGLLARAELVVGSPTADGPAADVPAASAADPVAGSSAAPVAAPAAKDSAPAPAAKRARVRPAPVATPKPAARRPAHVPVHAAPRPRRHVSPPPPAVTAPRPHADRTPAPPPAAEPPFLAVAPAPAAPVSSRDRTPLTLLLALLVAAVGIALWATSVAVRRRRRAHDLAVEAELQELIVEQRARSAIPARR